MVTGFRTKIPQNQTTPKPNDSKQQFVGDAANCCLEAAPFATKGHARSQTQSPGRTDAVSAFLLKPQALFLSGLAGGLFTRGVDFLCAGVDLGCQIFGLGLQSFRVVAELRKDRGGPSFSTNLQPD